MTISEAVKLAKENKQEGFSYLYEATYKDKYYIAYKYMKSEDAANDVLQDAYIKAFSKLDTLSDPGKFDGWLGIIVANTAKNALAKNNPMLFSELETADEDGNVKEFDIEDESEAANVELQIDVKERAQILSGLIDSLSDEQRLCILMFYYEKKSISDIADTFGVSENTIKTRLHYGKKNLKKKCEEYEKKGYKFLGLAPVGLLLLLLDSEKAFACAATGSVAAGSVSAVIAKVTGGVAAEGASAAAGSLVTGAAGTTAAAVAKKGLFATLGAKIAAGLAVIVVGGAIIAGVSMSGAGKNDNKKDDNQPTVTAEATEQAELTPTETPTPTPSPTLDPKIVKRDEERALLKAYKQEVLIPTYSALNSYDSTEFLSAKVGDFDRDFQVKGEEAKGIFADKMDDFDADDSQEMIVFYTTPYYKQGKSDYRGVMVNYIVCDIVDGVVVESDKGDFTVEDSFGAQLMSGEYYESDKEYFNPTGKTYRPVPIMDFAANTTDMTISYAKNAENKEYIIVEARILQEKTSPLGVTSVWELVNGKLVFDLYYLETADDFSEYKSTNKLVYIRSSETGKGEKNKYTYYSDSESDNAHVAGFSLNAETGYKMDETSYKDFEIKDFLEAYGLKPGEFIKINHLEATSSEEKPVAGGDLNAYRHYGDRYDFEFEAGATFYHGFFVD